MSYALDRVGWGALNRMHRPLYDVYTNMCSTYIALSSLSAAIGDVMMPTKLIDNDYEYLFPRVKLLST